jgi:hypothetical protein
MSADFPAAHSMDTEWFAVDANGRIGIFESGEPGPVPLSAKTDRDAVETLKQLFLAAPLTFLANCQSQSAFHMEELFRAYWTKWGNNRPLPYRATDLFALVRGREQLPQLKCTMEFGRERMTPDGPILPVVIAGLSQQGYEELHRRRVCLGCINPYWLRENRPERLGIYRYGAWDNSHNGPYTRAAAPDEPLLAADIPVDARATITAVSLPISFENSQNVQPLELVPCKAYRAGEGETYLGSDMTTIRPVPENG